MGAEPQGRVLDPAQRSGIQRGAEERWHGPKFRIFNKFSESIFDQLYGKKANDLNRRQHENKKRFCFS
jgi:hypothetical protein